MIYAMVLWAALAASQPNDIDVKASLHGYNLLWPSTRCCAFDFHLAADGRATVTANISSGKKPKHFATEFTLTPDQLLEIRQAISDTAFFGLPKDICCGRRMEMSAQLRLRGAARLTAYFLWMMRRLHKSIS